MRNHYNVSVSFPSRKSKVELKIAMEAWDILKATYLIALLHISNENTAYLFEISRYIKYFKYFETRPKRLLCGIKGMRLISYSSQTRSGSPLFISSFGFPYDRQSIEKV